MSEFWRDRRTLVTGATGLLGATLTRLLHERAADVVCLVRDWVPDSELVRRGTISEVTVVRGTVTDGAIVERVLGEYEIDTVFHLAAQTTVPIANRNPISTLESNVAGTWSVLEACRRSPTVRHIVTASSDKAYGDAPQVPYTEDMPLAGRHPYDASKACADLVAQSYAATYGLPVVISRCGNLYGEGDLNWNRLIPGTIRSILRAERPVIRSNGQLVRDYFYVPDGAAAYMVLAERLAADPGLRGRAYNFSSEEPLTVMALVERILALMGSTLEPDVRGEATNEIATQSLSAARAREELGWRPLFDLDEGLRRTIGWYRELLGTS